MNELRLTKALVRAVIDTHTDSVDINTAIFEFSVCDIADMLRELADEYESTGMTFAELNYPDNDEAGTE